MEQDRELALRQEVAPIVRQAQAVVVRSQEDRDQAVACGRSVKAAQKKVVEFFAPMKADAHATWKRIIEGEATWLNPLKDAERTLKATIGAYDAEQERKAEEERRRLQAIEDAKAERARAAAEAAAAAQRAIEEEARRRADEARRAAEQADAEERPRLQKEAAQAERDAERAAAKAEAKEDKASAVIPVAVHVDAGTTRAEGESRRIKYTAECVDLAALAAAATPGSVALSFLSFNQGVARRFAQATKGAVAVPGVKFIAERELAWKA